MSAPSADGPWGPLGRPVVWITLIVVGLTLAYANSLKGPLIFDDLGSIADNPSIRHLSSALTPPSGAGRTVEARPLLNASLALNYAVSGQKVWSYHLANLLIHAAAALFLFGFIRRTLALPILRGTWGDGATPVAGLIALLWAVHPLQTESVTYIVQRAESLAGCCVLASLYGRVRAEDAKKVRWLAFSAGALLLGVLTKEIAVMAVPLIVLFEWLFLELPPLKALKTRPAYHAALGACALLLAVLMVSVGGNRSGSIGFGIGVTPWAYLLTQAEAVWTYLRLSLLPSPLILDYGAAWVRDPSSIVGYALVDLAVLTGSVLLARRSPRAGFIAAWFWLILAPTSSVIPGNRQTIAEHRMYLPLAAVVAAAVLASWLLIPKGRKWVLGCGLALAAVAILGTYERNSDYTDLLALYGKTAKARPGNPYALNNYGFALGSAGRRAEAEAAFHASLALWPTYAEAHYNLGVVLAQEGRLNEAAEEYRQAVADKPHYKEAAYNLGLVLIQSGHPSQGIEPLQSVVATDPTFAGGFVALANAEASSGRGAEAVENYHHAVLLDPSNAEVYYNLGMTLGQTGHRPEALEALEKSLALASSAQAEHTAGVLSALLGQYPRAKAHLQKALALQPDFAEAHLDMANLLAIEGQPQPALTEYRAAATLQPNYPEAYYGAGSVFARAGDYPHAIAQFQTALKYRPGYAEAQQALAYARAALSR